jgi:hypothetical protein
MHTVIDAVRDNSIADDHRPLGDETDRRTRACQRFDGAARQAVVPFDRLVRIGGGAERHLLARPRRLVQLALQDLDEVRFDEDHRRELVVGIHFELDVIAAGEAVVAAVGAAAIGIERPLERHAFDAVQRRPADDLLVASGVRATLGFRQRCRAAFLHQVGDLSGRRLSGPDVEENERPRRHSPDFRHGDSSSVRTSCQPDPRGVSSNSRVLL